MLLLCVLLEQKDLITFENDQPDHVLYSDPSIFIGLKTVGGISEKFWTVFVKCFGIVENNGVS